MAFIEQSRFHVSGNFASNEKKKKKKQLRWKESAPTLTLQRRKT